MNVREAYDKGFKDCLSIFISDVDLEMKEPYVRDCYDPPDDGNDGPGEDAVYVTGQGYFSY